MVLQDIIVNCNISKQNLSEHQYFDLSSHEKAQVTRKSEMREEQT